MGSRDFLREETKTMKKVYIIHVDSKKESTLLQHFRQREVGTYKKSNQGRNEARKV